MDTKKSLRNMTKGNNMKRTSQLNYLNKEHNNNEKNRRLKCLKIPI